MDIDIEQARVFAKESTTLNEFLRKIGHKFYGTNLKRFIKENNIDVKHLNISYRYIDQIPDEDFKEIIATSKFWKDAMQGCGFNSYIGVPQIKQRADKMNLDTSHILGEEWAKEIYSGNIRYTLEQICVENSFYGSCKQLMQRLKRELGWEHKCSSCENTTWTIQGKEHPIPLELEHKNGNHFDHRLENLTFLCPNCHAFTSTYKGRNQHRGKKGKIPDEIIKQQKIKQEIKQEIKKEKNHSKKIKKSNKCLECNCDIPKDNLRCFECNKEKMKINHRPPYEQLIKEVEETSFVAVGKKYGVSDNAIRKWLIAYGKEQPETIKKCQDCNAFINKRSTRCRKCSIKCK